MASVAQGVWQVINDLSKVQSLGQKRRIAKDFCGFPSGRDHSGKHRSARIGQHLVQSTPRWTRGFKKLGKQSIGKSRGGWSTKLHVVSADDKVIVDLSFLQKRTAKIPGSTTRNCNKRRNMVARLFRQRKEFRRVCTRYDTTDVMFFAFVQFAFIAI